MRIAVFASGGGSNFQSIVDATREGRLDAEVVLCVASRATAGVISRAEKANIPVYVLENEISSDIAELLQVLAAHKVDFIALAGFMKLVPAGLIRTFQHKIVNIHPALLPAHGGPGMYGMSVHRAVIAAGETVTGATVHFVEEEYDSGPVILQETIPVISGDSPEDLAAKVLALEHSLYPRALQYFASNRIQLDGRRVIIRES